MKELLISAVAVASLAGCAQTPLASSAPAAPNPPATSSPAASTASTMSTADIATAVSGSYRADKGHTYITFSYSHRGYANPIVHWRDIAATMNFDADNHANSEVSVIIDAAKVDSGVQKFDDHLRSADFFEVETYPQITFSGTELTFLTPSTATLTGDLTMKGITKPLTLNVTLNKVGKNTRTNSEMIGISATGILDRREWDLGLAAPVVGAEVSLNIQAEFATEPQAQ